MGSDETTKKERAVLAMECFANSINNTTREE